MRRLNNASTRCNFLWQHQAACDRASGAGLASPLTIKHARLVQKAGEAMVGPIKGVIEWWDPNAQYTEKDISLYFWLNGTMPHSDEFNLLVKGFESS
jgi:hypothetical protein